MGVFFGQTESSHRESSHRERGYESHIKIIKIIILTKYDFNSEFRICEIDITCSVAPLEPFSHYILIKSANCVTYLVVTEAIKADKLNNSFFPNITLNRELNTKITLK